MKPVSMSEFMMYSTVKLVSENGSSGTGFFFHFEIDDKIIPMLVTNKHVVSNDKTAQMSFSVHLGGNGIDSGKNYDTKTVLPWIFHPTHDICVTPIAPIMEEVCASSGDEMFYTPLTEDLIYNNEFLKQLSALEAVTMVGYPRGLSDELHNFPIFRRGYTAAHPGFNFNEEGKGLVDIACFPGSSGSPIFILDETTHYDKPKNAISVGSRLIFLGVLHAGPTINADGEIVTMEIPTRTKTSVMMNLGYYVKANTLLDFLPELKTML